jgi:myo-inositol-1(or 4)-monophosphatase
VPDAAELVDLACDLARAAGTLTVEGRRRGLHAVHTKSSATDMVTEFDRQSERLIVDGLLARRPHDGIVGEEGAHRTGTSGVDWLVDPIDGTTNYLYGIPTYAVSIAARDGDGLLAGVVHMPVLGETFHASRGGGAFLDGEPIHCSSQADLAAALVATGFSYDPARRVEQGRVLQHVIGLVRDIRRIGSAAADLCYVACGRVDAYYERGLSAWDLAAGELIATEAGAVVSAFDGEPTRPGEAVATNPGLHLELLRLLAAAEAT